MPTLAVYTPSLKLPCMLSQALALTPDSRLSVKLLLTSVGPQWTALIFQPACLLGVFKTFGCCHHAVLEKLTLDTSSIENQSE